MARNCDAEKLKMECLEYFRSAPIWRRIFDGFCRKYRSYGKFAGSVVIKEPSSSDIETLEGFFCKNFHGRKSITISADKFERALEQSRYAEILPEEILEDFFGKKILGKAEEERILEERISFLEDAFRKKYSETPAEECLSDFEEIIKGVGRKNTNEWGRQLFLCAEIFNRLPYRFGKKEYLAVFAAKMCGNPHAFDAGTTDGGLLYKIIQYDISARNRYIAPSGIFPSYKRQKSYLDAGIMIDDMSNSALIYNVHARKKDGHRHSGIEGFFEEKSVLELPLNVIADLSSMNCIDDEIYIVENPSVFALMCDSDGEKSYMCMNGQPVLASLIVLDFLAESQTKAFYSGDLDPEGLLIAQKLSRYYKGDFEYWHMEEKDYKICISNEELSERRIKMLDNITDERLVHVAECIRKTGFAGYQENIFGRDELNESRQCV